MGRWKYPITRIVRKQMVQEIKVIPVSFAHCHWRYFFMFKIVFERSQRTDIFLRSFKFLRDMISSFIVHLAFLVRYKLTSFFLRFCSIESPSARSFHAFDLFEGLLSWRISSFGNIFVTSGSVSPVIVCPVPSLVPTFRKTLWKKNILYGRLSPFTLYGTSGEFESVHERGRRKRLF